MKYKTKEWYNAMQRTNFFPPLQADQRAENFSDEFFNELYEKERIKWIEHMHGHSYAEIDDTDCETYTKFFESIYQGTLNSLHSHWPAEIIQKVADLRILALGYASEQVFTELTDYCTNNSEFVEKMSADYRTSFEEQFKDNPPSFIDDFNFHDCTVISSRKSGKNLVITFDNEGSYSLVKRMILKDAVIIKQDKRLFNSWWLYDEIYKTPTGYEIHVLLDKKGLIDFIVSCSDIIMEKYDYEDYEDDEL